ncbi:hypothetical protein LFL96_34475 [Paraburkholderia sp. D15]|uniref:hypothetical protein n=1 Tax=Paraburkholderia sp. D15 TaxID=2880218 RepID=UPI002479CA93|nr:hypothetical protein [Paraburkholderia sp. D15]WGS53271.1 hypothetical protein LFL96_34475 [Paraburkholderia sp. D15]
MAARIHLDFDTTHGRRRNTIIERLMRSPRAVAMSKCNVIERENLLDGHVAAQCHLDRRGQ